MLVMKIEQRAYVDVAQPVAISQKKRLVILEIPGNALQSPARHGLKAGVGEGNGEILFVMSPHELNLGLAPKANLEVAVHGFVVEKIFFDHVAAIAETEHKLADPIVGVHLHDVPQDGAAADFHHRLGTEFGFFPESGTRSTTQNNNLHNWVLAMLSATGRIGRRTCDVPRPASQLSHTGVWKTELRKSPKGPIEMIEALTRQHKDRAEGLPS